MHYKAYDMLKGVIKPPKKFVKNKGSGGTYSDNNYIMKWIDTMMISENLKKFYLDKTIETIYTSEDHIKGEELNELSNLYLTYTSDSIFLRNLMKKTEVTIDKKYYNTLMLKDLESNDSLSFNDLIKSFNGKILYIDFWASWCNPCREEFPFSIKLFNKINQQKITMIFLAFNDNEIQCRKAMAKEKIETAGRHFLILNSRYSKFLEEINLQTIPRYLIIDKSGQLKYMNAPSPKNPTVFSILNKLASE